MKWEQDLIRDIRGSGDDDRDLPHGHATETEGVQKFQEKFLSLRDNCRSILEIGVNQYGFTNTFLEHKLDNTVYVGIDTGDRDYLKNPEKLVHIIRASSSDVDSNIELIHSFGVTEFDFIFIDGWHSINQVLIDWEYTKMLAPGGTIGFHDTNHHPGPKAFFGAIDTAKWHVENNIPETDWGVGFLTRK